MSRHGKIVSRLRDPEYTGANRCLPCTVVNLLIAASIAVALGAVLLPRTGMFTFVPFVVVAFGLFVGVIYLRGYLVPGTPTITKRYFPTRLLALFGKRPPVERTLAATATPVDSVSGESIPGEPVPGEDNDPPVGAAVVRYDERDADLTPNFRDEWTERMAVLGESEIEAEDVRAAFCADSISRYGEQSFVLNGNQSLRWGSQAALVADVAAAELLRTRLDEWPELDGDRRRSLLMGLRFCLDQCPSCDGRLSVTEDRVDPCCQKPHLVAESVCDGCGAVIADAAVVEREYSDSIRTRLLRP